MGGAAAFVSFGPVDGDERPERVGGLIVVDAGAAVVRVDVAAREDHLIEELACHSPVGVSDT